MRRTIAIAIALAAGTAVPAPAAAQVPGREADPVVLKGASLPKLDAAEAADVVAFRWTGSAWDAVPVQVDERAMVSYSQIYGNTDCTPTGSGFDCDSALLVDAYTDPGTWTGPDPDTTIDSGDEIAFMAKDTGPAAPPAQADPANVEAGTRTAVEVTDPLGAGGGYVYLFESDGSLDPGAGTTYVNYFPVLTSGDYKTTYSIADGPNPETTSVVTPYYRHDALTDRWFDRDLKVLGRGSTEVDILDGDKAQFSPAFCGRSETTFAGYASDRAEGAFVTNKGGPVRAIRSYMGANSGPFTQKTHIYYEQREDLRVDLRVHAIPAVMSFLDYSPGADGMKYRNPANTAGVTIDGVPDAVNPSPGGPAWEQVTGVQGTLDIVNRFQTDISPIAVEGYYYDNSTPDSGHLQCSGDNQAWGSSGSYVTSPLPTTDPRNSGYKSLAAIRHVYFDAPNQPATQGALRNQQITSNLGANVDGVQAVAPGPPVAEEPGPPAGGGGAVNEPPKAKACRKGKVRKKGRCVKRKKKRKKRR